MGSMWDRVKASVVRTFSIRDNLDGIGGRSYASDSGEAVGQESSLSISTAWACVNLIAGTVGSLSANVTTVVDGARQTLDSHPLQRILSRSPNAEQTPLDFFEGVAGSLELAGNSYSEISRNKTGAIVALLPMPASTQTSRTSAGRIRYNWIDEQGKAREALDNDVLHVRGFGGGPLGGLSTLQNARHALGLARAADRTSGSLFRNGMRPSGVLTFKEWLKPEQRKKAKDTLTEEVAGSTNSGKPIVLEGGTEWTPLAMSFEDAQMLQSRRFSVEEICRFFGVPPHMVGHTEKSSSWGTGIAEQTLGFLKFTLRRRLKRVEQALEKQLLSAADRAKGVQIRFNIEGLLRADSKGRAEFYQLMTQMGAMTINEVRSKENLKPVTGGDVPRMQMQQIPITEAGKVNEV